LEYLFTDNELFLQLGVVF